MVLTGLLLIYFSILTEHLKLFSTSLIHPVTHRTLSTAHTHTHKCIGGKSGFNILPETWIEPLAFQLADDLLFFVSHSHPGE